MWWHETLCLENGSQECILECLQFDWCRRTFCFRATWFKYGVWRVTIFWFILTYENDHKYKVIFFNMLPLGRRSKTFPFLSSLNFVSSLAFYLMECVSQCLLRCTICCIGVVGVLKEYKVALHLKIKDSGRKQMEICVMCFNLKEIVCKSDLDIRKHLS